jgi:hypothetical protein
MLGNNVLCVLGEPPRVAERVHVGIVDDIGQRVDFVLVGVPPGPVVRPNEGSREIESHRRAVRRPRRVHHRDRGELGIVTTVAGDVEQSVAVQIRDHGRTVAASRHESLPLAQLHETAALEQVARAREHVEMSVSR